jgi:ATP-dependent protease ClpP protease subunit
VQRVVQGERHAQIRSESLGGAVVFLERSSVRDGFMFPFLNTPAHKLPPLNQNSRMALSLCTATSTKVSAKHVVDEIQRLNRSYAKTPIYLFINSPGGLTSSSGGLIVTAIKTSKRPVYTVCVEECASMAAIIHAIRHRSGTCLSTRTLMFHEAAYGVQGQLTHNRSREAVE